MQLFNGDCLKILPTLPPESVDMILCDPPYGRTRASWDKEIPPAAMWREFNRVIKRNGAMLIYTQQPFTSAVVMANLRYYRYEWIWKKTSPRGHLNAKRQPLRAHENIVVFYKEQPTYNPQKTTGHKRKVAINRYERPADGNGSYGAERRNTLYDSTERYPLDVQEFSNGNQMHRYHVNEKPVAQLEYFVLTYTDKGQTVLDATMGSASTGIACLHTGREFIGIEKDPEIYRIAENRLARERAELIGGLTDAVL